MRTPSTRPSPNRRPDGLADLGPEEIRQAQQAYFQVVDAHIPAGFGGLVVDKLPLNIMSLDLIHRLFPTARVVCSLLQPHIDTFGYAEIPTDPT